MNYRKLLIKVLSAEVGAKFFLGLISLFSIRFMPIGEFATYAFALSSYIFMTSIVSSVINIVYITSDKSHIEEFQSTFFSVQVLFLLLVISILLPLKPMFNGAFLAVILLALVQFIFLFNQTFFQKKLQFRIYYGLEYVRVLLFFTGFVALVNYKGSFITANEMIIVQFIATVIPVIFVSGKVYNLKELINLSKLKKLLFALFTKPQVYLLAYFIFVTLLLNVDLFLLKLLSDTQGVAEYGAAFRYYAVLQVALISIHKILLPMIANAKEKSVIKNIFIQHKKICYQAIYLFPLIYVGAVYVIPLIDGGKYPSSINIFLLLALSSYFSFCFSPYANVVIKEAHYIYMFKCVFFAVTLHIILAYLLISSIGSLGAALSNLFSYGLFNFFIYRRAKFLIEEVR